MYSSVQLAKKYITYWLKASNGKGHGTHSPFVFDFIKNVLNKKPHQSDVGGIEQIRHSLQEDNRLLTLQDFGAGSSIENIKQRRVSSIAKNSLKSEKCAQLIYKIVKYYQPKTILELGTCLGITTSYLASANKWAAVHTMEGAHEVAQVAKDIFKKQSLDNIQITEGNFDDTLPAFIENFSKQHEGLDFAFIDGNHREAPTVSYFHALKPLLHKDSIVVFDDIHWSEGMERAWEKIKNDDDVTLSIDLFFIGIVFFKKEFKVKQHFTIRY
ncbi:O-methyltransferase [Haoranjiania flava]|uniref:Class I SAM-dependent methyltransferase n=1 Tax=Haoranjiania flava TaxID=1856322 RepID=A0AAE3LMP5_9BACT|nr:class I SAM-dependent methyltransferase [Haoranjiania flava]MCU7694106.1 class I SAM-dependent methyltransferase [Haoranjiania flava]